MPSSPDLHALFAPQSIALIGATDRKGTVGRALLENLREFPGTLFPINPNHKELLGHVTYPSLSLAPCDIDLAIIATPAASVPGLIRECVARGIKAAIIISAGFKEVGAEGAKLEQEVLAEARRNGLRIVGPNCLGLMAPHVGLNATFATALARPGRVAFLSQSGALCTAILDWSFAQNVGFSAFVSVGSMLDVGWGDLITHFGNDDATTSIVIYMESIGDAAGFIEAARHVAAKKPIVVIKAGRTAEAARAAASHTGAMTGSDAVLDAAFRRAGVLRVDSIEELFDMAEVLSKQPLPHGPRLAIVTNAGGPGALATDAVVRAGGALAELTDDTMTRLNAALPAHWSHGNPVDVLGDANEARYENAFRIVAADPNVDGLLAVLTPQAMTKPDAAARSLINATANLAKPVLASWMGDAAVASARGLMNAAGLPTYDYPDEAARAFQFMWQRHQRLQLLAETNRLGTGSMEDRIALRERVLEVLDLTPRLLNEFEAKQMLQAAGIPCVDTRACTSEDEAVHVATALGVPTVLKLLSKTITHKTDGGGVRLNLTNADAVREAWRGIKSNFPSEAFDGVSVQPMIDTKGIELIAGCTRDPQFGPVLLFGAGGIMVEVFQDRALALPPLSPILAHDWISQTKIHRALQGLRGRLPIKMDELLDVLVRLGDLVLAVPEITELDINPLLASHAGVIALDARMVIATATR